MDYMLNLEKGVSPKKERKLSHAHTPTTTIQQFDVTYEKEIQSLLESKKQNNKTKIIGICGGQSSGKSKITEYLHSHLENSIIIAERDFFVNSVETKRKRSVSEDKDTLFAFSNNDGYSAERKQRLIELSNPDCYNTGALIEGLNKLKNGESFMSPFYDTNSDDTLENFREIKPDVPLILLEGMFMFRDQRIRDLLDFGIYVEVDDDVRLSRMVIHENYYINNNAKALNSFFIIYEKYIKTSFEQNIEPTKKYAHIIIPNFHIGNDDEIQETPSLKFLLLNMQNLIK